jgi:hypothetical protein
MAGTGWTCSPGANTCSRADALDPGASYPPIVATVNVTSGAGAILLNSVSVLGGGSAGAAASDPTTIVSPTLGIAVSHSGNFAQGQAGGQYSIVVTNALGAAPTGGTVTVTESVPAGLTLTSMAGTGWTCPGGPTCTRNDSLPGGSSFPPITATVDIAQTAPTVVANGATVSAAGLPAIAATDSTIVTSQALRFLPITPCRVADTRGSAGVFGGPAIAGGTSRDFPIPAGACGIPATARAYSLDVAVVPPGPLGFLTVWPAGQPRPVAATLNSTDGRTKASAALIAGGAGGAISVFATNATDVVLDISGYFVPNTDPAGLAFFPVTPCRVADTRQPTGPLAGPALSGGQSRPFPIGSSNCNLPATAQAYSLSFAAVPSGPLGFLTAWPDGLTQPLASQLNAPTGTVTADAVIVSASPNGSIDVFASNTTNLVIDVNGYFGSPSPGGLSFFGVTPCRVLDTRRAVPPVPVTGMDVAVAASPCGIPAQAQAFVLNVTVVPPGPLGYLTLWPQGQPRPVVSTLNASDAAITSNLAIVPAANGVISVFASNPTHIVIDILGYFSQ